MRAPPSSSDAANLFAASVIEDPQPFFSELRKERPLSRVGETGVHLVASWELIDEALGREDDFSANLRGVLVRGDDGLPEALELPYSGAADVIATADEPHHGVHRALLRPALEARRAHALEPSLRDWTRRALEPWLDAGGGDFAAISEIVPARAVAHILGLPEHDGGRFRAWAMMGGDMLAGDVSASRMLELGAETRHMANYLAEHLESAMGDPSDGPDASVLQRLSRGVLEDRISRQEAIGISIVLFGAGGESTAALIGSAMRRLAEAPDLADRLRHSPRLIPRFVEEVVRLEPPFKFHYRSVLRDCQFGGCEIEEGDKLMLLWASANRDTAIFDDPDEVRLDRRHPKHHLGFGRGSHFCIGAPLARLGARIVIEETLARTKSFRISPDARPRYTPSLFVRRLEELSIGIESTAPEARYR